MPNNLSREWLHNYNWGAVGRWFFGKQYSMSKNFAGTIKPKVLKMQPGHVSVQMKQRKAVHNHIGTVHAIAVCNLIDTCMTLLTDASIHRKYVWTPIGMDVNYKKKCTGKSNNNESC
jgi:acyl-coenzyme A thioesterase PaaI-like protein